MSPKGEAQVSDETVLLFALSIGISASLHLPYPYHRLINRLDVDEEQELLRIARRALTNLPEPWELAIGEGEYAGIPFFHNSQTNESIWTHPEEDLVRQALEDKRRRMAGKRRGVSRGAESKSRDRVVSRSKERLPSIEEETADEVSDKRASSSGSVFKTPAATTISRDSPKKDAAFKEAPARPSATRSSDDKPVDRDAPQQSSADAIDVRDSRSTPSQQRGFAGERKPDARKPFQPRLTHAELVEESNVAVQDLEEEENEFDVFRRGAGKSSDSSAPGKLAPPKLSLTQQPDKAAAVGPSPSDAVNAPKPSLRNAIPAGSEVNGGRSSWADSGAVQSGDRDVTSTRSATGDGSRGWQTGEQNDRGGREPSSRREEVQRGRGFDAGGGDDGGRVFELEQLRQRLLSAERDLVEERGLRRKAEESAAFAAQSSERRLREATESNEDKCRDLVKKTRAEVELEAQDKVKQLERRYVTEIEDLKGSLHSEKRRAEEARLELEALRRKMLQSMDEVRSESSVDLNKLKLQLSDAENALNSERKELKKLREEYAAMASRLASSLEISSVAQAEMEALRLSSASATAEAQTCHAALIQATQRMQQLDSEVVALKTENYLIKQENETNLSELRKLRLAASSNGDRAKVIESEIKRKNIQFQVSSTFRLIYKG